MSKNVLFVDDDRPTIIINERLAKKSALFNEINSFNDSRKALAFLKQNQSDSEKLPDVIFLDVNMPALNGWDFLKEFQNITFHKNIKVIMLSTSDKTFKRNLGVSEEIAKNYETKPLTVDKITKHIGFKNN